MPKEINKAVITDGTISIGTKTETSEPISAETSKETMSMRKRIKNAEGGEWVRYSKGIAKQFGKAYSTSILPITYNFQEGMRTFVLDEHVEGIWNIFDKKLRAEGDDINSSDIFADANPENMIQGSM